MTPHNRALKDSIAKTVLMPGDPLRAKYIADNFLENVELVNDVRNMLMYTGEYKGKKVSICASGMGRPSIGIYSYELFKFYDVDNIVRIGSGGSYIKELHVKDLVLANAAYSDSKQFNLLAAGIDSHITYPSKTLNQKIIDAAEKLKFNLHQGQVHSSDVFYGLRSLKDTIEQTKSDCVEMEAGALFANAFITKKSAACLLTISDSLVTHEEMSASERQNSLNQMIELALESI